MSRILIVEDDTVLCRVLRNWLERKKMQVEVATTLAGARRIMAAADADIVLSDLRLPDGDGIELLEWMNEQHYRIPFIVMTQHAEVLSAVRAMKAGAEDYLPKPFHLAELNARIKSVIRRQRRDGEMDIRLANIRIVPDTFQVFVDDKEIELNRKEYDILLYFANRPGRLVNKNTLAESVWGDHIDQVDNFDFIYAQIKNLRKKLKDAGALAELKAVYGFGYKMTVE